MLTIKFLHFSFMSEIVHNKIEGKSTSVKDERNLTCSLKKGGETPLSLALKKLTYMVRGIMGPEEERQSRKLE